MYAIRSYYAGSHERYKTEARLHWEAEHDGLKKMREWILEQNMATEEELSALEKQALTEVLKAVITSYSIHYTKLYDQ